MTELLLVVCSMTLARRQQTHDHQTWYSNVEPGDRRVLPSGVQNEQRLQRLISRAHWDILVQCHGLLWRAERACTQPRAANEVCCTYDASSQQSCSLGAFQAACLVNSRTNCQGVQCEFVIHWWHFMFGGSEVICCLLLQHSSTSSHCRSQEGFTGQLRVETRHVKVGSCC